MTEHTEHRTNDPQTNPSSFQQRKTGNPAGKNSSENTGTNPSGPQTEEPHSAADVFDIDLDDLDFDLEDFDLDDRTPDTQTRFIQPRMDPAILTQTVHFDHAMELAEKIDLSGNTRTFAWVSGAFVFGDILEALWRRRNIDIKNLAIASLSISDENIDSWAGLMAQANIERFDLLVSAYFYSHEKWDLVPYLYKQLGNDNRFQVAFGAYHLKVITLETHSGHTLTIHGSANMRSSTNVEQIMVEVNDRSLHDFNAGLIRDICDRYGTINHNMEPMTRTETSAWWNQTKGGTTHETEPAAVRIRKHPSRRSRRK